MPPTAEEPDPIPQPASPAGSAAPETAVGSDAGTGTCTGTDAPAAVDEVATGADARWRLLQYGLFWAGWWLLFWVFTDGIRQPTTLAELIHRPNVLLPPGARLAQATWIGVAGAAVLWIAAFVVRLRRAAGWRATGNRPVLRWWWRLHLAWGVACVVLPGMVLWAEGLLVRRPEVMGDARRILPIGGLWLDDDRWRASWTSGIADFTDVEVGYRHPPLRQVVNWTKGDTAEMPFGDHFHEGLPRRRVTYRFDARGFAGYCGRRPPPEQVRPDVVVTGDSMAFGAGVPMRTAFPTVLDRILDRPVYNLAVTGSGPPQQVRLLRKYGYPLAPRVAVWAFCEHNDVTDSIDLDRFFNEGLAAGRNLAEYRIHISAKAVRRGRCSATLAVLRWWMGERPTHNEAERARSVNEVGDAGAWPATDDVAADWEDPPDGRPVLLPDREPLRGWASDGPLVRNRDWFLPATRKHVPGRFNPVVMRIAGRDIEMSFIPPTFQLNPAAVLESNPGAAPTRRALADFAEDCRRNGVRGLVVQVPYKLAVYWDHVRGQVTDEELAAFVGVPKLADGRGLFDRHRHVVRDFVEGCCREAGVEFLDLHGPFREAAARGECLYLQHDTHLSPDGHRLAAEEIARRIRPWLGTR